MANKRPRLLTEITSIYSSEPESRCERETLSYCYAFRIATFKASAMNDISDRIRVQACTRAWLRNNNSQDIFRDLTNS